MSCYQAIKSTFQEGSRQRAECLENEIEFLSYLIILSSSDPISLQKDLTKFDLTFLDPDDEEHKNEKNRVLFNQAIRVQAAISTNDPADYFLLLGKVNYLFSCVMLRFLNDMRKAQMECFHLAIGGAVSLDFLQKTLKFYSKEDTIKFIMSIGFETDEDTYRKGERQQYEDYKEKFAMYKQRARLEFMDSLRGDRSRRYLMTNGIQHSELSLTKPKATIPVKAKTINPPTQKALPIQKKTVLPPLVEKPQSEDKQIPTTKETPPPIVTPVVAAPVVPPSPAKSDLATIMKCLSRYIQKKVTEIKKKLEQQKQIQQKGLFKMVRLVNKCKNYQLVKIGFETLKEDFQKYKEQVRERQLNARSYFDSQIGMLMDYEYHPYTKISIQYENADSINQKNINANELYTFGPFLFSEYASKFVTEAKRGLLRVTFLSGRKNIVQKPGSNSKNLRTQSFAIENNLIKLFTDQKCSLNLKRRNKIEYSATLNDDLDYQFLAFNLNQSKQYDVLMGSSFVVLFSKTKDIKQTLEKFKQMLAPYSPFSKIRVFLILYQKQALQQSQIQEEVIEELKYYLDQQVIFKMKLSFITITTIASGKQWMDIEETIQPLILQEISVSLQSCIEESLTVLPQTDQSMYSSVSLHYLLITALESLMGSILSSEGSLSRFDQMQSYEFEQEFQSFLFNLEVENQESHLIIMDYLRSDVDVYNLWMLLFKDLLENTWSKLIEVQEFMFLNGHHEQISQFSQMKDSIKLMNVLSNLELLHQPIQTDDLEVFQSYHLSLIFANSLKRDFEQLESQSLEDELEEIVVERIARQLRVFQETNSFKPFNSENIYYKGTIYFKIVLESFLEYLKQNDLRFACLINDALLCHSKLINQCDFQLITSELALVQKNNDDQLPLLKQTFSHDFSTFSEAELPFFAHQKVEIEEKYWEEENQQIGGFESKRLLQHFQIELEEREKNTIEAINYKTALHKFNEHILNQVEEFNSNRSNCYSEDGFEYQEELTMENSKKEERKTVGLKRFYSDYRSNGRKEEFKSEKISESDIFSEKGWLEKRQKIDDLIEESNRLIKEFEGQVEMENMVGQVGKQL